MDDHRYFYFSYAYPNGFGNFSVKTRRFAMPSRKELTELIAARNNIAASGIIILTWQEFSSYEDYVSFTGEE